MRQKNYGISTRLTFYIPSIIYHMLKSLMERRR